MTFAQGERTGISKQRSYWLRCFLGMRGTSLAIAVAGFGGGMAHAQTNYDCFYVKTAKVAHVRGVVVDQQGEAISGAKLELLNKGEDHAIGQIESDTNGGFQFEIGAGQYWIHVEAKNFQPVGLSVRVDHGFFSFFNTRRLYVVLPVGGTAQPCPAEITSKKKLQEYVRDNAAQK